MATDLVDLEAFPDNKRARLQQWLTAKDDANPNIYNFLEFMGPPTTIDELEVFLSPFDCADELLDRLLQVLSWSGEPMDDTTLTSVGRDHRVQLAHNARLVGEAEWAGVIDTISEVYVIDSDGVAGGARDVDSELFEIECEIGGSMIDAVEIELAAAGRPAANLYSVYSEAFAHDPLVAEYVIQPLLLLDLRLEALARLWSCGDTVSVHTNCEPGRRPRASKRLGGVTIRRPDPRIRPATFPRANLQTPSQKAAARANVDWSVLPTTPDEVGRLTSTAEAGDYPSLAKLSLMHFSGVGVDVDVMKGLKLLERAAGDFHSVVSCFEAGQRVDATRAGAHYGMSRLHREGWGVAQDRELASQHADAADAAGFGQ